jgi:phosphatidylinositol alpha-1,6-mannosyltransferase
MSDKMDVIFYEEETPGRLQIIKAMRRVAKKGGEVLVSHIYPFGTLAFFAHVPYSLIFHGMDFDLARRNWWRGLLSRFIIRGAKNVVANSLALAREIADFASIPLPIVASPCVSDEMIRACASFHRVKKTSGPIILLTVGRLVERKGHARVLAAMRNIPSLEYHIVGDGPFRESLEAMVEDSGLKSRVQFFSSISHEELPRYYQNADIFVMPTISSPVDREGFGIVYLEAGLFELPVIASDLPGVDEAVLDQVTGCLVKSDDELSRVLSELAGDSSLREKLGQAGKERARCEFSKEKTFAPLINLWFTD